MEVLGFLLFSVLLALVVFVAFVMLVAFCRGLCDWFVETVMKEGTNVPDTSGPAQRASGLSVGSGAVGGRVSGRHVQRG